MRGQSGFTLVEAVVALAVMALLLSGLAGVGSAIAWRERGLAERRWMMQQAVSSLTRLEMEVFGEGRLDFGLSSRERTEMAVLRPGDGRWRPVGGLPAEGDVRLERRILLRPFAPAADEVLSAWPQRVLTNVAEAHGVAVSVTVTSRSAFVPRGRRSLTLRAMRFD